MMVTETQMIFKLRCGHLPGMFIVATGKFCMIMVLEGIYSN
jgi:hypothetical protein